MKFELFAVINQERYHDVIVIMHPCTNYSQLYMLTTWNCVPGLVCQAGWYGGTDCVPVVKGSELIVSQLLLSGTQFQTAYFV